VIFPSVFPCHRFWLLNALRAHANVTSKTDLRWTNAKGASEF
jgi:hypothetical protein